MSKHTPFTALEHTFGVAPQEHYEIVTPPKQEVVAQQDADKRELQISKTEDYVETELINTVDQLNTAIDKVSELGELSEHPGAYRVLGELASTKVSALKELRELRKRDSKAIHVNATTNNTQVNATGFNLNDVLKALKNT